MKARWVMAAFAALLATGASAGDGGTSVYRCGNTYQATPCAGGKTIDGDGRGAGEVAAARDVATRDRQLADAMTRDRENAEARIRPAPAISIGPRVAAEPAKTAKGKTKAKKRAKDGVFVATVPGSGKKKKVRPA